MSKFEPTRRGVCKFCAKDAPIVDYKDIPTLQKFSSAQGKMFGRKKLGTCAKHQRLIKQAVKRARFLGLLRYIGR
ncbi:MAG: 30S ribosomal protein S18 [Planctomycetes bacterium]|nr:30S ribosomal protein S18 [Planctomycetota bacterium]